MNPLYFVLDLRSGVPIYVQIVEQVQELVNSGKLKPGDQLPTVRQLASELRVNFNTIARAYRMLDDAGLISTQQGRGTYIVDQPSRGLQEEIKRESLKSQTVRFLAELSRQGFALAEIRKEVIEELDEFEGTEEEIN